MCVELNTARVRANKMMMIMMTPITMNSSSSRGRKQVYRTSIDKKCEAKSYFK